MATSAKSDHASNVANMEDLISICTGLGAAYNPTNVNLKMPALQTIHTNGLNALQTVKTTKTPHDNACNAREIVFKPIKKLSTRVTNAFSSSGATQQSVDDVKAINRKIQGKRAGAVISVPPVPTPTTGTTTAPVAEVHQNSVSQQGMDNIIDNFTKFIVCVSAEPLYIPNEPDLKVAALNTTLTTLKTTNTAVINATTPYHNALIARDVTLYQPITGLVDIALAVKNYVKSVFGASSPQYKQVSGLVFKNFGKR